MIDISHKAKRLVEILRDNSVRYGQTSGCIPGEILPDNVELEELTKASIFLKGYIKDLETNQKGLLKALKAAAAHLDWAGYGDSYERKCANDAKLPEHIQSAIEQTENNETNNKN